MDTKALKQKILDLAIRGKFVPQDLNDEPASVLLEKIRAEKQQMVKDGMLKSKDLKNDTVIFVGEDNLHYEKFSDGTIKCLKDEIPFEVPAGWSWCRLKNISTTNIGLNYHPEDIDEQGVAVLRSNNIKDSIIDYSDLVKVNCTIKENQYLNNHDILICSRNGSKNLVGKCAVYEGDPERFSFGAFMAVLRTSFYEYVYYYLLTNVFRKLFHSDDSKQINQVTQTILKEALIPLPPFQEQSRISSAIKSLFSHIDSFDANKKELTEVVSQTKSKILDLAIRGKLVPQDPNDEPASVLLERIRKEKDELIKAGKLKRDKRESVIFRGEDNSYYETIGSKTVNIKDELPYNIPSTWAWVRLGTIGIWGAGATPNRAHSEYYGGNIPWLKTGDLNDDYITEIPETITELALKETSVKLNPVGSILIAMYGATIGKLGILTKPATTNQACCACCPVEGVYNKYLFYFLMSHKSKFINSGIGGAQPNISKEKIVATLLPLPPFNEQKAIVARIEELNFLMNSITADTV